MHSDCQVRVQAGDKAIEDARLRRLSTGGGSGEVRGIRAARDENVAGGRIESQGRDHVVPPAAEVRRLKQCRECRIEPGDEAVGVSAARDYLCAAGHAGKIGGERRSRHEDLAATGIDRGRQRDVAAAAAPR